MPFRYDVSPCPSNKTNCFRPNAMPAGFDHDTHEPATLGSVFCGHLDKVSKQNQNDKFALVWEVAWFYTDLRVPEECSPEVESQAGSSTPKIRPTKPKMFLLCRVSIKPQTWVKLT